MFNTLTEFFCWLSLHPNEGMIYAQLAGFVAYPPVGKTQQQTLQDLQSFLAPRLQQVHIDIISNAITKNEGHAIPDAVSAEQFGPVGAYFEGVSLIWT